MDIAVAEIEDGTGNPVGGGQISLDPSLGIDGPFPAHDRLLLEFRDRGEPRSGLTVWPVLELYHRDNEFCGLGIGGLGVYFAGISRNDIDTLLDVDGDFSLIRGGSRCGWIIGERMKMIWQFESFELHRRFSKAGMHLAITGRLTERDGEASKIWSGRRVRVESMLCWEVLTILGFVSAAPHWKFDKAPRSILKQEEPEEFAVSGRLRDLRISQGLTWPFVVGSTEIFPTTHPRLKRTGRPEFLTAQFGAHSMSFSDAPRVMLLNNGFAQSNGANFWVTIKAVGADWLTDALSRKTVASMSAMGDGLGSFAWDNGYASEAGDPFRQASQRINRINLSATLHESFLEIVVSCNIDDFEPNWFEEFRREKNASLLPLSAFKIRAVVPKALLIVRGLFRERPKRLNTGAR